MIKNEVSQFIPIKDAKSERVRFDVVVPEFVDAEKIGVNFRDIRRLCRIAGISHLRVESVTGESQTPSIPQVVGYNKNGEAYAASGKVQAKDPVFDSKSSINNSSLIPHSATWVNTVLRLNIDEISDRIGHDTKWAHSLRSPEAWANYFNLAVKQGITKEGAKHLIFGMNNYQTGLSLFQNIDSVLIESHASMFNFFFANFGPRIPRMTDVAISLIIRNTFLNSINFVVYRGNDNQDGSRLSLIYGPQVDRAILLIIMAKTKTLIKAFSNYSYI